MLYISVYNLFAKIIIKFSNTTSIFHYLSENAICSHDLLQFFKKYDGTMLHANIFQGVGITLYWLREFSKWLGNKRFARHYGVG